MAVDASKTSNNEADEASIGPVLEIPLLKIRKRAATLADIVDELERVIKDLADAARRMPRYRYNRNEINIRIEINTKKETNLYTYDEEEQRRYKSIIDAISELINPEHIYKRVLFLDVDNSELPNIYADIARIGSKLNLEYALRSIFKYPGRYSFPYISLSCDNNDNNQCDVGRFYTLPYIPLLITASLVYIAAVLSLTSFTADTGRGKQTEEWPASVMRYLLRLSGARVERVTFGYTVTSLMPVIVIDLAIGRHRVRLAADALYMLLLNEVESAKRIQHTLNVTRAAEMLRELAVKPFEALLPSLKSIARMANYMPVVYPMYIVSHMPMVGNIVPVASITPREPAPAEDVAKMVRGVIKVAYDIMKRAEIAARSIVKGADMDIALPKVPRKASRKRDDIFYIARRKLLEKLYQAADCTVAMTSTRKRVRAMCRGKPLIDLLSLARITSYTADKITDKEWLMEDAVVMAPFKNTILLYNYDSDIYSVVVGEVPVSPAELAVKDALALVTANASIDDIDELLRLGAIPYPVSVGGYIMYSNCNYNKEGRIECGKVQPGYAVIPGGQNGMELASCRHLSINGIEYDEKHFMNLDKAMRRLSSKITEIYEIASKLFNRLTRAERRLAKNTDIIALDMRRIVTAAPPAPAAMILEVEPPDSWSSKALIILKQYLLTTLPLQEAVEAALRIAKYTASHLYESPPNTSTNTSTRNTVKSGTHRRRPNTRVNTA